MSCNNHCVGFVSLSKYSAPMTDTNVYFDCESSVGSEFLGLPYWSNDLYHVGGSDNTGRSMLVGYACYSNNTSNNSICSNFVDYSYIVRPFFVFSGAGTFRFKDSDNNNVYIRGETLGDYYVYGDNVSMPVNGNSPSEMHVILPDKSEIVSYFVNKASSQNPDLTYDGIYAPSSGNINFSVKSGAVLILNNGNSLCNDMRSSGSTESCVVGLVGQFASESYSQSFTLLFQPDANHTSGELNNLGSVSLHTLDSAYCRFDNTLSSVRGVGVISLWGHLSGFYNPTAGDLPSLLPYTGVSRVICSWSFDDPCCPSATGFSDNIDSFNAEYYEQDLRGNVELVIDKIVWSGFERLTDYCCDDSDCVTRPNDDIGFDGNHENNDDDDDDCVCEELVVLEGKFDALISTLGAVKDSLDAINYTLQHKDFTVTVNPEITVEPCEPNITVEPCQPQITVSPSPVPVTVQPSPVPVTVQPASPTITVEPCQPQITVTSSCPDVYVNNSDLISCLNGLFKVDSDSLAQIINDTLKVTYQDSISGDVVTDGLAKVIKDKEFESDVICEVSKVDWAYEGFGNIRIPNDN